MRFGWIAIGSENTGSTRHFVLNCHNTLLDNGYFSEILSLNDYYFPDIMRDVEKIKSKIISLNLTHIVFQKVLGIKARELILWCKKIGLKVIYNNGDWYYDEFYHQFDRIFVGSLFIKNYLEITYNLKNVSVMYDMIEYFPTDIKKHETFFPTLGWFGNKGKMQEITSFIKRLNYKHNVITISNTLPHELFRANIEMGDGTNIPWGVEKLYEILFNEIDILIIPIDVNENNKKNQYAKTANRAIPAIQLGIPVVYTPIPSYNEIFINKVNGCSCSTLENWKETLELLSSPFIRKEISEEAKKIEEKFMPNKVIEYFLGELKK